MLWAGIYLPHLALDGVLRQHPSPEEPLVLVTGTAQRRTVLAANRAAQAVGLRAGLPLNAAHTLVSHFGCIEYDPHTLTHLQALLAAWAYQYSALVCLEREQILLLEVQASLGLFGPWPRFAQRLRQDLTELGFQHRLALAPTPLAAGVLAQAQDGAALTSPERLTNALRNVPLAAAPLADSVITALHGMGIRHLGQLLALPRDGLLRRFGSPVVTLLDRLQGREPDPREYYQPPDLFESRLEFNYELAHTQALLFPLRRMLGDLTLYLLQRDRGVQRFELKLLHAELPPTVITLGLLSPSRDPTHLFDLCRTRLERVRLPAAARGLQLRAPELPPFIPALRDLFASRAQENTSWVALRERLRARLGEEALGQLEPQADPRPEHSLRRVTQLKTEPAPLALPPRPSWLLPQPVPWPGGELRIITGPERIEAGWWDGDDVRRDYYVAETHQGQRAWVFRPAGAHSGTWMLHGWFA